jgi:hypothetical protein
MPSWASLTSEAWRRWSAEKLSEQLRQYFSHLERQSNTINIEEAGCPNNAWCSWEKNYDEVYPLYFSEKYMIWKSKHIHCKVKCAYLVIESGSKWRRHVMPRSKKKSLYRDFDTKMHHQVHRIDVVPKLAERQSISLVARSKNLNCPLVVYESNSYIIVKSSPKLWSESDQNSPRAQHKEWSMTL